MKNPYLLGHSTEEHERLAIQSRFFGDLTEYLLVKAGITRGMSVLDVGCGIGDVSFALSRLVGPTGSVIAIDQSQDAIQMAQKRASERQIQNVAFLQHDIDDFQLYHKVDAVVGRLILMHLPDPVDTVRRLCAFVRSRGVITFQDINTTEAKSLPYCPLFEKAAFWIRETLHRGGAEIAMGLKLYQTFIASGVSSPEMLMLTRTEAGPHSQIYEIVAQTVRTLLPKMLELGVVRPEEVRIETLATRLRNEVVSAGALIFAPPLVGVWSRKP